MLKVKHEKKSETLLQGDEVQTFGDKVKSTGVSAVVFLILGSMLLWGLSSLRGVGNSNHVAKVGGDYITSAQLSEKIDAIRAKIGREVLDKDVMMRIEKLALKTLIEDKLIEHEAKSIGVRISNEHLAKIIVKDKLFKTDGKFDKAKFAHFLSLNGLSEHDYINSLKQEIERRVVIGSVGAKVKTPEKIISKISSINNKEVIFDLIRIPQEVKVEAILPSDAQIKAFYEANKKSFKKIPFRRIDYIDSKDIEKRISVFVDEDQVESEYGGLVSVRQKERRTFEIIVSEKKEDIDSAIKILNSNKKYSFSDAWLRLGKKDNTLIKEAKREDLQEILAELVFSSDRGKISQLTELGDGKYAIIKVKDISFEKISKVDIDQAKNEIRKNLKSNALCEALYAKKEEMKDALSSGKNIAEIASKFDVVKKSRLIDNQHSDPLSYLFSDSIDVGYYDVYEQDQCSFLIFKVSEASDNGFFSLEEARKDIVNKIIKEEIESRSKAYADDVVDRIKKSDLSNRDLLAAIVDGSNSKLTKDAALSKKRFSHIVSDGLKREITNASIGDIVGPVENGDTDYEVAIIRGIKYPEASEDDVLKLSSEIDSSRQSEIFEYFIKYMYGKHKVKIYKTYD